MASSLVAGAAATRRLPAAAFRSLAAVRSITTTTHAAPLPRSTAATRRVNRPRKAMETATIADPFAFDNPQANPSIILRNAIALGNCEAAIRALQLCAADPAKLAEVTSADAEAVVKILLAGTGKLDVEEVKETANMANGLIATPEGFAALIQLWGRAGDTAAAVRTAKAAASLSPASATLAPVREAVVTLFADAGHSAEAAELLKRSPSPAGYAAVIRSYAKSQSMDAAVDVYEQMLAAGASPTAGVIEALIDGYAAKGRITSAFKYFNELKTHGLPQSTAAWTGMIRVHAVRGNVGDAVSFYRQMREAGIEASADTYTHLIAAHGKNKDVAGASRFFYKKELVKGFAFSPEMYSALIDAYAIVGQFDLAWRTLGQALKATPEIGVPDVTALATDVAGKHAAYLRDMIRASGIPPARQGAAVGAIVDALVKANNPAAAQTVLESYGKDVAELKARVAAATAGGDKNASARLPEDVYRVALDVFTGASKPTGGDAAGFN
ncbi:hypothetical protein HDU88_007760 [Geranomyces variabilis]|nr:hypothetical protein HDU88_007760 [Geranomyces variabilis]